VAGTSIAGRVCIDAFETVSVRPVIGLLSVVDAAVRAAATHQSARWDLGA